MNKSLDKTWQASLHLQCKRCPKSGRTILAQNQHDGPLRVQKALYPEPSGNCHIMMLHPPAGIAAGDELSIRVKLDDSAQALLTTPGATKWYGGGKEAFLSQQIDVAQQGFCEWLPQENIIFNNSFARTHTQFHLHKSASLIAWEMTLFGRQASGEQFKQGHVLNHTSIYLDKSLVLDDVLQVDADSRWFKSPIGLNNDCFLAHLWLLAPPASRNQNKQLVEQLRTLIEPYQSQLSISCVDELIVARFQGNDVRACFHTFCQIRKQVRDLWFSYDEYAPRIWAT